jgi:hypothetical protein
VGARRAVGGNLLRDSGRIQPRRPEAGRAAGPGFRGAHGGSDLRCEPLGRDTSGGNTAPLQEDAVLGTARSAGASAVGTGNTRKTSQIPFWGFTLNFDDIGTFLLHGFQ